MRKKRTLAVLAAAVVALTAVGCAREVTYVGEERTEVSGNSGGETGSDSAEEKPGSGSGGSDDGADGNKAGGSEGGGDSSASGQTALMKQLGMSEADLRWEGEEVSSDYPVKCSVSTDVTLPEADGMMVVEAEAYGTDSKDRERITKALFGGQVYDYGDEYKDRDEIRSWLEHIRGYDLMSLSDDSEETRGVRETVEHYEELTSIPQKTPVLAEDFSGDEYLGTMDGTEYRLSFDRTFMVGDVPIWFSSYEAFADRVINGYRKPCSIYMEIRDSMVNHRPEELADFSYSDIHVSADMPDEWSKTHLSDKNKVKLTSQEATEIAERFLGKLDLNDLVQISCDPLVWSGERAYATEPLYAVDGYMLCYVPGVDSIPLVGTKELEFDFGEHAQWPKVVLYINDEGILFAEVLNMVVVTSVKEKVELLSLSAMKEDVFDLVTNRWPEDEHSSLSYQMEDEAEAGKMLTVKVQEFKLNYSLIMRKENGKFSYTFYPTWRIAFSGDGGTDTFYINAIDGSGVGNDGVTSVEEE